MQIKYIDRESGEEKIEKSPIEGLLKFLYDNPFGRTALLPLVKRKFVSSIYGRRMNRSSSKKSIDKFVKDYSIDLSESKKNINEFETFNEFFYRELKTDARPVETGFVSPGDGKLLVFENINDIRSFYVKGQGFTLDSFLLNADLARIYLEGTMIVLRLAPDDYHRFHFPYQGIPSEPTKINGSYFSVSPYALKNNFVRVFCENKRSYSILKTKHIGNVLISPVGATMVGSIINTFNPGQMIEKGDEMGYFAFGGSTIVILLEKNKVKIDEDILRNTQNKLETYVRMGEKIGQEVIE